MYCEIIANGIICPHCESKHSNKGSVEDGPNVMFICPECNKDFYRNAIELTCYTMPPSLYDALSGIVDFYITHS